MNFKFILLIVCLTGTAAGMGTALWLNRDIPAGQAADIRPVFSLPDLEGQVRHVDEWDGQWLLLNFWATWCKPCREEIPLLIETQAKHGDRNFQIIGLALDDREPVTRYATDMRMNYPVLVDAMGVAKLQDAYGGGAALPYSVLISPEQQIVEAHRGELKAEDLNRWLETHLPER